MTATATPRRGWRQQPPFVPLPGRPPRPPARRSVADLPTLTLPATTPKPPARPLVAFGATTAALAALVGVWAGWTFGHLLLALILVVPASAYLGGVAAYAAHRRAAPTSRSSR